GNDDLSACRASGSAPAASLGSMSAMGSSRLRLGIAAGDAIQPVNCRTDSGRSCKDRGDASGAGRNDGSASAGLGLMARPPGAWSNPHLLTFSAARADVMSEVTRILDAIEQGDPHAAEQLLPLVYQELRRLAAQKLARERPGQTLDATALVHEAYLRLVAGGAA